MDLRNKTFDELVDIAKLNNVFIPGPINKKDLERHISKNVNLKNNRYQLLIDIRIYIDKGHENKSKNLVQYIEDNIHKVPKLFFGDITINLDKRVYMLGDVTFDSYRIKMVDSTLIRIILQRETPFFKEDSDRIEKVYENFKYVMDKKDIMFISSENLEKYKLPNDFGFELEFEKVLRIGF
jgi:hypothetical protein